MKTKQKNVGRPNKRGETTLFSFRISKSLSEKIELYSSFSGYTKTQICETLVQKGLDSLIDNQKNEIKEWQDGQHQRADIFNNFTFKK